MGIDRTVVAGLVAALAVAGSTAVAGASQAAPAPQREVPPVRAADLPSVEAVARIYPALAGGTREVIGGRAFLAPDRGDCLSFTQIGRAASGRWSSYSLESGGLPFFEGEEDPSVFVYRFATQRKATRTMRRLDRFVRTCEGHVEDVDISADVSRMPRLPRLGDQRIGYRRDIGDGTEVGNRGLHLVVRRGRTLTEVYVQKRDDAPDRARGVRLARLLLRTSAPS